MPKLPAKFTLPRPDEGQRRAAMVRWLSDKRNVLTWRPLANCLFHNNFGRGIGKIGALPSHPELLDDLACDRTMGDPSVRQFATSKGIHVTPNVDYHAFDIDSATRRSLYRFLFRTLPDPFFDVLDCPDASQFTPARAGSITPLQALALLNDRFMVRQAEHLAARLRLDAGVDERAQVGRLFVLALSRPATKTEVDLVSAYAKRHGMPAACRIVMNGNEFHFVE